MKKILLAVAITTLASTAAFAGITNTKHDLSSSSTASVRSTNNSQICAFCHTPHNATVNVPLWNRSNPLNTSFKLYTSSATLTPATKAAKLDAKSISLLCLSCHDGTVGQLGSRVVAKPDETGGTITMKDSTATFATGGAMLGSDLTNDHPIGFDYATAQSVDAGIRALSTANTNLGVGAGSAFFGSAKSTMECSSCHLVHDNSNVPFLRTTNSGSTLCLACHNK